MGSLVQLGNHAQFRNGATFGSYVYILNLLSQSSVGAYSLNLVRSNYTGFCIRVRRSSDNTEINIGFVNGFLDIITLLSFVGVGTGFVTIWYDQSGAGLNVFQTNASFQPRIVISGVLNTANSKPSINFNGSQWLIANSPMNANQAFIVEMCNSSSFSFEYSCGSIVPSLCAIRPDAFQRRSGRAGVTNELGQFIDDVSLGILRQYTDKTTPSQMRRNGVDSTPAIPPTVSSTQGSLFTIGSRDGVTAGFNGNFSQLLFFQSPLSEFERNLVERYQFQFFLIT